MVLHFNYHIFLGWNTSASSWFSGSHSVCSAKGVWIIKICKKYQNYLCFCFVTSAWVIFCLICLFNSMPWLCVWPLTTMTSNKGPQKEKLGQASHTSGLKCKTVTSDVWEGQWSISVYCTRANQLRGKTRLLTECRRLASQRHSFQWRQCYLCQ